AEVAPRAPSPDRRAPDAAARPFAPGRIRPAARSARHELAADRPAGRPDGARAARRADPAVQRTRSGRGARRAPGDRDRRPRRPAALCALRRPAPESPHRARDRRRAGAAGARRADQRDGPGGGARAARPSRQAQVGAQPERRAGHPPAHRDPGVRHRRRPGGPRTQGLRGGPGRADDRAAEARAALRPRGPRGEGGRQDRDRDRRRSPAVSGFADFWAGRDLWREPMIAGVLAGAILGYIGVFVVLKRIVFVSAALSEISGVGVAFAFWLSAVLGIDPHLHGATPLLLEPTWFSLLFACAAAALFSFQPGHRKLATE